LGNRYFVSSYPQINYYLLYFAVRVSDQTYCAEYETPVLDEIDDLFSAKDKDVEFVLKGKSITLRTPKGRKRKARLVEQKQCNRAEHDAVELQQHSQPRRDARTGNDFVG